MVNFQTPEGESSYIQFETVDESVAFVESLRNEQNVLNARIFQMEELKFEFRPYFRVQLAQLGSGAAAATATAAAAPVSAPFGAGAQAAAPKPAEVAPIAAPPAAPVFGAEAAAAETTPEPPAGDVRVGAVTLGSASAPTSGGDARPTSTRRSGASSTAPNGSTFGAPEEERGRRGLFGR